MDRHVLWMRGRILASIARQATATFFWVALIVSAVLIWRSDFGVPVSLLFGFGVGQVLTGLRILHALARNPLSVSYLQEFVAAPFVFRVEAPETKPHDNAAKLAGFWFRATLRDPLREPTPVFDVFDNRTNTAAASLSRVSGALTLISCLTDGRLLVTDGYGMPPHEQLLVNVAESADPDDVIRAHIKALRQHPIVELRSDPVQVVFDVLVAEHRAYTELGLLVAPFFEVGDPNTLRARLTAPVDPDTLRELRLGRPVLLDPAKLLATPLPTDERSRPTLRVVGADDTP